MFKILSLEQRTLEWHDFRLNHVCASDAPIIMGVSPWKNVHQLWLEKCMLEEPGSYISSRMQRGIDLEPIALESFKFYTGIEMIPCVVESENKSWMGASLDGISQCKQYIVEIKCPGLEAHAKALSGKIPEYYFPQIQHQLAVTGLPFAYYYSFDGEDGIYLKVDRDEEYIKELIKKEEEFWYSVQNFEEPVFKFKNYQYIQDEKCQNLASKLLSIEKQLKELETEEKELKNELILQCKEKNSIIGDLKLSKVTRKGNVDYNMIPELKEVNLEKYRKSNSEYWKLEAI